MATYKVNSDGKAPSGLSLGDVVVTGGGTYKIIGFKNDGAYQSALIDPNITTYNYTGAYSTPPAASSSSGNSTSAISGSYANLASQLQNTLSQKNNSSYTPAVTTASKINSMSFDDAVTMAERIITPQYQETYAASAANANQRLEKQGLYDTVYGQSLAADAERDVTGALNSAIVTLALQLSQASDDQAMEILNLAVKEKQFAADYNSEQKSTALNYLLKLLQG